MCQECQKYPGNRVHLQVAQNISHEVQNSILLALQKIAGNCKLVMCFYLWYLYGTYPQYNYPFFALKHPCIHITLDIKVASCNPFTFIVQKKGGTEEQRNSTKSMLVSGIFNLQLQNFYNLSFQLCFNSYDNTGH